MFYLGLREALLHPFLAHHDESDWPEGQKYTNCPSTKIDALITILRHHLETPGAWPLQCKTDGTNRLVPADEEARSVASSEDKSKDRIVVYLAFPKNNWMVRKVCVFDAPVVVTGEPTLTPGRRWLKPI